MNKLEVIDTLAQNKAKLDEDTSSSESSPVALKNVSQKHELFIESYQDIELRIIMASETVLSGLFDLKYDQEFR